MSEKFIDIEKVIGGKNPRLLKVIPNFLIRYLKRILHEDELNWILETYGHKQGVDFVESVFEFFQVTYSVDGYDNFDSNGRYLFAANHPLGGLDGMILIHAIGTKYPKVKFPVNDLLLNLPQFSSVFLPINKHGTQSVDNVKMIEEAYKSDDQILYFPAGLCSRKKGKRIEDLEWKKNFIAKAVKHQRDVVPVFIGGSNSNFFYNLANLRSRLGIKANIEMLYLSNEMFKQKNQNIHLTIGKPIPYSTFDFTQHNAQWWAEWVKGKVYQMHSIS